MQHVSRQQIGKQAYNTVLLEKVFCIQSIQSGYRKTIRAILLVEGWQFSGEAVKKRISCKSAAVKRRLYV
jgi:hypothetical protein